MTTTLLRFGEAARSRCCADEGELDKLLARSCCVYLTSFGAARSLRKSPGG